MYFMFSFFLFLFGILNLFFGLYFMLNNYSLYIDWEIVSFNSTSFFLSLIFDYLSLMFMSCVLFISSMVLLYSYSYMFNDMNNYRFLILVYLFIMSMLFMIISPNMVSILLGWDGLGLVSYCLVIYFQNSKSYNAGMLTIITNRIGDVAILICISWLMNFGSWNFVFYMNYNNLYNSYIFIFVIIAAFTKSAQIPFSSWLPAAMAAPTPVSSLVHSSTLVTAGVYLLIRYSNMLFMFDCSLFIFISFMTMFMSGLGANFEFDLKKIIALSTLSQLGLMMSILFIGFPKLAFLHLLGHAFFKALLFLCSGLIIHAMGDTQDIREMGYVSLMLPYTTSSFMISSFSLSGMPFLSGFYSKDLILEMLFMCNNNMFIYLIFMFSVSLTMSYSLRLVSYLMLGGCGNYVFHNYYEDKIMNLSMILLIFFSLTFGCLMIWLMFQVPFIFVSSFLVKLMPIISLFLGLFIWGIFYFYNMNMYFMMMNPIFFFLGSMWFMPKFSTYFIYSGFMKLSKSYMISLDSGWGEFIFSKSHFLFIIFLSKLNYFIEMNNIKLMMITFIFLFLFILI
uniref:NADH dehydrogenase subunit 5 n=1 Tax=Cyrtorhinus lividipennis TaxID=1032904 RepID=UPI0021145B3C|nr:NADH dehydrogenase subunit 5 [Cyrtorhinus lividipennis]USH90823.1 NADH dehydrogenase subunit 5 [Cyrtorhinus lividipennis]